MPQYAHLHVHTQYSLLDGASKIPMMLDKAVEDGQCACAISDHGNMFGAFEFVAEANKRGIKPIVGCEFYIVEDRHKKSFSRHEPDKRYHQLLLAKNQQGYHNLAKLCSLGFIQGYYNKFPRIDKELIPKYKEGIIATSCCIGAEIPQAIIHKGEEEAEKLFQWWLDQFGEDFYVELQRHHIPDIDGTGVSQEDVNQVLLKFAKKYNVKVIATNDSHYIDQDDWDAHDILLCVNTGSLKEDLNRFKFFNDQFFFKTQDQMAELFNDIPQALETTIEIVDKIEAPQIKRDVLLPNYTLPEGFKTMDDYLRYLTTEGAKRRYGEITSEIHERLELELGVIKDMGFSGYFLIVQDFISAAKDLGVWVGPGRGSAAGSVVAFCTGITNVDPIKYNLLFERFLNPERVSMPDIDIDFDDFGRQKVIDYVIDKYGKNQVAQIVTFGTMAAKSSIRDVARVLDLPLPEADRLAKLIPPNPGMNFRKAMEEVEELREIKEHDDLEGETIRKAESLEGAVRQTGVHAAGVIIAPDDLLEYIPVCTSKDAELYLTQFEGKYIEEAGMLKMDFLGLKTLSILKDAVENVRKRHDIEIDLETLSLEDEKTFELFQRGDTVGIFQFESDGMRNHLRSLKPTNIEDLIAMNALYRPGPMEYIPEFVARKHGHKKVVYPHESLEDILKATYGIMVYQEQIMQTAQIIGGFSLGSADILRRAMGKKKMEVMDKMQVEFVKGAGEKGIDEEKAVEIFDVMKEFAKYGFNRSHSAAYSILAYQTGYLKAHYPAEFMAAVLTHNMGDLKKVKFFLDAAKRYDVQGLGPDINESDVKFTVNPKGEIRCALTAIKGVGAGAAEEIVKERNENGPYKSVFDFVKRLDGKTVNKRLIENLVLSGSFDCFEDTHRAQYFHTNPEGHNLIEIAVDFGKRYRANQNMNQHSLFGEAEMGDMEEPKVPVCEEWTLVEKLAKEKEMIGLYISGHPLDDYELEMKYFTNSTIADVFESKDKPLQIAGMVTTVRVNMDKKGRKFGIFQVEDGTESIELALFGEDYLKYKHMLEPGTPVHVSGTYKEHKYIKGRMEFRISGMELLSEIREKRTKSITLYCSILELDDKLIKHLAELLEQNPGPVPIKLEVFDPEVRESLPFLSRRYRVSVSQELMDKLTDQTSIYFKLN